MPDITRFRPEDRRGVEALYRRVFGADAADANRLRWDWQYRRNPLTATREPLIWIAREGPTIVGQYGAMPVRLSLAGRDIDAAWGMDVMVAPERQRQGLGETLFRTWDQHVGASLGLGLSEASYRLFLKLKWPDAGPVPCLVKPLTRRAFRRANWPLPLNRIISAVTFPFVQVVARLRPIEAEVVPIQRFDAGFTTLWDRLAPKFTLAVRRDAAYLNWKYVEPPHVRYAVAALRRSDGWGGYAVYRHAREARGRTTLLVDFLTDPDDVVGFRSLLGWVDRAARDAYSDKIRAFCMHEGFRRVMRRSGYFQVKSTMEFAIKINEVNVPATFYDDTSGWHVTLGDSDQDR